MRGVKTVHTIQLNNGTESRTSKTHVYGACVVSTVTQQVVDNEAARLQAHKDQVELLTPQLAARLAELGTTLAEVEKTHDERATAFFHAISAVQTELKIHDRAKAEKATIARGYVNPYTLPEAKLLEMARNLEIATLAIKRYQAPVLGDQCVLAWSRDVNLALKVKNSYHMRASEGYALTVRTDITIKQS